MGNKMATAGLSIMMLGLFEALFTTTPAALVLLGIGASLAVLALLRRQWCRMRSTAA
jgi:hypothetical protein